MRADTDTFTEFAAVAVERLRAGAYHLCRDWHLAQDLTQTALTRLYLNWAAAARADNLMAYANKVVLRAFLDHRRRRVSTAETACEQPREQGRREDSDLRLTMLEALAGLPERDRAIVLLRYFEDFSVERTAEVLGVPAGVVRTRTMRSLARLRETLAPERAALFATEGGNDRIGCRA